MRDHYEEIIETQQNKSMVLFETIKNPLIVDANGHGYDEIPYGPNKDYWSIRQLANLAKTEDYDGVIIKNLKDAGSAKVVPATIYIAFNPNQIKSALYNEGAFSTKDDNIYHSLGEINEDVIS